MKTMKEVLQEVDDRINYYEKELEESKIDGNQLYIDFYSNKLDIYKSIKATLEGVKGKK